jgi:2-polyprenyl-6-methoxyphenol hydroxylase-like FAD-dependent oxidoreductase
MKLLDETGADENAYARNTPRLYQVIGDNSRFKATIDLPQAFGRDYAYAIDRARFDAALWENAARFATVETRQNFSVIDLMWEGKRVTGIIGHEQGGDEQRISADLVVGADGRFSLVARKVNAREYDVHTDNLTTLLYAYWKNVRPYENGPAAVAYEGGVGYGLLVMDCADDTTAVTMEGQAALLDPQPGQTQDFYLELLRNNPKVWQRLEGAEMVTKVHGMRRIGNLYRQPGGPGWALVGDAYHQHDPLDGQGIFNALFTAKSLAWAIRYWKRGDMRWSEALNWYDETTRIKTYGMYRRTLQSVRDNFFNEGHLPGWAIIGLRWVMEDPTMRDLLGKMLTRQILPEVATLATPPIMLGAMLRGSLRDFRKQLEDSLS